MTKNYEKDGAELFLVGVIKKYLLLQHHRYGSGSRQLRYNVAFAVAKHGDGRKARAELWSGRLRGLLLAVKSHYTEDPRELQSISSESVSSTDLEEYSIDPSVLLTKQGKPSKRQRQREVDGGSGEPLSKKKKQRVEVPATVSPQLTQGGASQPFAPGVVEHEGQLAVRMADERDLNDAEVVAIRRGEMNGRGQDWAAAHETWQHGTWAEDEAASRDSIRPGKMLLSPVLALVGRKYLADVRANRWSWLPPEQGYKFLLSSRPGGPQVELQEMKAALPMTKTVYWAINFAQHWILAVVNAGTKRYDVYDSLRGYAHEARTKYLQAITKLLRKVWGKYLTPTLRQCPQQGAGSNDCGLYCLRNFAADVALLIGKAVDVEGMTREWLIECWESKDEAKLPELYEVQAPKSKKAKKKAATKAAPKKKKATTKTASGKRSNARSMKRECTPSI
jgi:hypothetical protein